MQSHECRFRNNYQHEVDLYWKKLSTGIMNICYTYMYTVGITQFNEVFTSVDHVSGIYNTILSYILLNTCACMYMNNLIGRSTTILIMNIKIPVYASCAL